MRKIRMGMIGGGIGAGRFQQLFLSLNSQGMNTPEELAQAVWSSLATQGQRLVMEPDQTRLLLPSTMSSLVMTLV